MRLYYLPGAVCAQKALLTMAAKDLLLDTREMTRDELASADYRALNPKGVVPTLVDDEGRVVVESSTIMRFIDESFDGPPLQPSCAYMRSSMNNWMKLMDEEIFPAVGYLTMATYFREDMGKLPPAELTAHLTRTAGHAVGALRADAARNGVHSEAVGIARDALTKCLAQMDAWLASHPWLAGQALTLADTAILPAFTRLADLGLGPLWDRAFPHVSQWWRRCAAHAAFRDWEQRFPNPMKEALYERAGALRALMGVTAA